MDYMQAKHYPPRDPLMRWILGLAALPMYATAAHAQIHPDAKSGKELADKLCVSCHIVGREASGAAVTADVPSFTTIANKPGQTAQAIAGAIVIAHPPMPQIQLTREEIGDLAAYIRTLRRP
jgi:mono/diheme cytochrome c family protein